MERIKSLQSHRKRYNLFIILTLAAGLITLFLALIFTRNYPLLDELPKFGFGLISSLSSVFLQNEKLKIENKLSSLHLILDKIDTDPSIGIQLIQKAITEI